MGILSFRKDTTNTSSKETFANLFQAHELKTKNVGAQQVSHQNGGWLFFLILIIAAVFAYLRVVYGKYLSRLASAFFNINISNQMVRDENVLVQRASLLLNFIFYASIALLLYLTSVHDNWPMNGM